MISNQQWYEHSSACFGIILSLVIFINFSSLSSVFGPVDQTICRQFSFAPFLICVISHSYTHLQALKAKQIVDLLQGPSTYSFSEFFCLIDTKKTGAWYHSSLYWRRSLDLHFLSNRSRPHLYPVYIYRPQART